MQVSKKQLEDTKVELEISADTSELDTIRKTVVERLGKNVKVSGFRQGKAPANLTERHIDPSVLQTEFLETIINDLYGKSVYENKLRPVSQPEVAITKFVPFTELAFKATVSVVGEIKLPDYKKMKVSKKVTAVTEKQVDEVLDQLTLREASKNDVDRKSKDGDEVWIDFTGVDAKTKKPINGADGKDYPLVLGSNTFIPGFEPELVGLKAGDKKTFTITFPEDYGVSSLRNKQVTFECTVNKVKEVVKPKVDDKLAAKVGPFKSVSELKADVKKQLEAEADATAQREYENQIITKITDKSEINIPAVLVDEELASMEKLERQNLAYRGQTWQEHLDAEGLTEEQHREKERPEAERRVKAGLVISEVSDREKVDVTADELETRINILKSQYNDPQMQSELNKLENRRDILSRMLTEKTLDKLISYMSQ